MGRHDRSRWTLYNGKINRIAYISQEIGLSSTALRMYIRATLNMQYFHSYQASTETKDTCKARIQGQGVYINIKRWP